MIDNNADKPNASDKEEYSAEHFHNCWKNVAALLIFMVVVIALSITGLIIIL